ncbi:MAG: glycosyltransferase family 4 protein [Fimbriimonadaceae bacterium]|nr:glycosyltransferase family 4 protein [Fimbriimonadaceae bacterium]
MSKPLRIAILTQLYPPDPAGGLEENAKKLAQEFALRGHEVAVFTAQTGAEIPEWTPRTPKIFRVLKPIDIVTPADTGDKKRILFKVLQERKTILDNIAAVRAVLTAQSFDVVYCFGVSLIGPGTTLGFSESGIPVFWHQGGPYLQARFLPPADESKLMRLRRRLLRFEEKSDFRHLCFVSRFLMGLCEESGFVEKFGAGTKTMEVIPRGIEFPLRKDTDRKRAEVFRFVSAGRIIPDKGYHNIVEALAKTFAAHPEFDWELWMVGEPDAADMRDASEASYMDKLQRIADEGGIADRVKFVGRRTRDELLDIVTGAHCFISASVCGEPFANTIIETLGCGTPLIVSDDGSSQEVVTHMSSAWVYPRHDVDALTHAILATLQDYTAALGRADEALRVIESRFTMSAIVDRTEGVLHSVVNCGD